MQLGEIFSPGAVVQGGKSIPVWGKAESNRLMEVTLADVSAYGRSGDDGTFCLHLPPLEPGGPFTLTVREIRGNGSMGFFAYPCLSRMEHGNANRIPREFSSPRPGESGLNIAPDGRSAPAARGNTGWMVGVSTHPAPADEHEPGAEYGF